MGEELRELIKGFLAKLEEDGPFSLTSAQRAIRESSKSAGNADEPFSWMRALRWCPRELVDLVNSKACRGEHLVFCQPDANIKRAWQARLCSMTR